MNTHRLIVMLILGTIGFACKAGSITVGWEGQGSNIEAFVVEMQSEPDGPFETIAVLPPDVSEYTQEDLQDGQSYSFRIFAVNATDFSEPSDVITGIATSAPLQVINPTIINRAKYRIEFVDGILTITEL